MRLADYWLEDSSCGCWDGLVGLSTAVDATVLLPEADRQVVTTTAADAMGESNLILRIYDSWPRVCTHTMQ